jgi:hypothetical protein
MEERSVKEDRVAKIAADQHGLVTWEQALGAGVHRRSIEDHVARHRWQRVHEGAYRIAGAPRTWRQDLLAGCLAIGGRVAVSHRAAATAAGVLPTAFDGVELTVVYARNPAPRGVIVHRLADLTERWIEMRDGIPCTTVARTLVDLGAVVPLGVVARALDRAVGRKLVTLGEVRRALDTVARKGRRGVGVMRTLLDERGVGTDPAGVFEARMAALLRAHGLPPADAEHEVRDERGLFLGRVDFAYPALALAIEVDGYESHVTLDAFRHDRARQNDLVEAGWTVLRFVWRDVDRMHPSVASRIARTHARLLGSVRHT